VRAHTTKENDMSDLDSARLDVGYALGQLRKWGDVRRAIDALERAEEALTSAAWALAEAEWNGLALAEPAAAAV
jgi:hypothetical protein